MVHCISCCMMTTSNYLCKILHAISAGVEYLHSHNIVHRDLKSLNVLLDKQLNPKLCDFGLAVVKIETESQAPSSRRSNMASAIGTIRWLAPEVMQGRSHSKHSDVWALGLIVAEVVTRKVPFHTISAEAALVANLSNTAASNFPLDLPTDCPASLQQIIHSCLLRDPAMRPEAGNVGRLMKNAFDQQVSIRIQHRQEQQSSQQQGLEESSTLRDDAESAVKGTQSHQPKTPAEPHPDDVPQSLSSRRHTDPAIADANATLISSLQNLNLNHSKPSSISTESIETEITRKLREVEILKEELRLEKKELERERQQDALQRQEREEEARRQEEEARRQRELEENNRQQQQQQLMLEARRRDMEENNRRQMEARFASTTIHQGGLREVDPSLFTQHSYVQRASTYGSQNGGVSTGQCHISSGSANGRALLTGPRGGTYYVNANGNKTYVSKR